MSPIRLNRFSNTRAIIIAMVVCVACVALVAYFGFQARFLIEGPRLSFTDELTTIQHERYVTLSGIAKNSTRIMLNGREIVTDATGAFQEPVVLENGYSVVRIEARDRYGRTSVLERAIVYSPAPSDTDIVFRPTESTF